VRHGETYEALTKEEKKAGVKQKNDIVESDQDLCKVFCNKFKRLYQEEIDEARLPDKPDIPKPELTNSPPSRRVTAKGEGEDDSLPGSSPKPESEENEEEGVDEDFEDDTPTKDETTTEHGIDVTSEFPTAAKVDLKVFKKGQWHTVIDPDDGTVLNEKKMRADKVDDFLQQYQETED